ncbi:FecCD family ABC transporter permease [Haloarcula amylolytica]|uniref:Cobalamin import system permease protein BtuC n=1 Tax=Haloarcula amylolytica JCM 13557 TaxID=1227452 RepID=M0KSE3_9EURY|nr:iron ABC transporter permease [Haloarcula amylolytica]EMA22665.1 transporter permease [Haloarcula amylolytica JCM 13557]
MATETSTGSGPASRRERWLWWVDGQLATVCLGSVLIILACGLAQVTFGAYKMTVSQAWQTVLDPDILFNFEVMKSLFFGEPVHGLSNSGSIIWNGRLPRVFVAILVGMNLGVSGAIFQAITRNELASPFILGVSSGAGLMILVVLVVFPGMLMLLPIFAAVGGAGAFLLVYAIAWKNGTSPVRLILAGTIVGTIFGSVQSGLFFFAEDITIIQSAMQWTKGSLVGAGWAQVRMALPFTGICILLSLVSSRQLNVLLLGEDTAGSLGMNVERVRFAMAGIAVLSAAASITVAGLVGFVGLIVPHVVRNIVGSEYKKLIIGCVFAGPAMMVAADVGARLALSPVQIPVGIVTGLIGGPYFLYLMRKKEKLGEL